MITAILPQLRSHLSDPDHPLGTPDPTLAYLYQHMKFHTLLELHNSNTDINELFTNNVHVQAEQRIRALCTSFTACVDQLLFLLSPDSSDSPGIPGNTSNTNSPTY